MPSITAGAVVLSWTSDATPGVPWGALGVVGACLAWAIDNNLTRRISAGDPIQIAAIKGLFAGAINLLLACAVGSRFPDVFTVLCAAGVGVMGYGVSLTFFVLALRQ